MSDSKSQASSDGPLDRAWGRFYGATMCLTPLRTLGGFIEGDTKRIAAPQFKPDDYAAFITTIHVHALDEESSHRIRYPTTNIAEWIRQVGPMIEYYQCTSVREDIEELIRTAVIPSEPSNTSVIEIVAAYESCFPDPVDWAPRRHVWPDTDNDVYRQIAQEFKRHEEEGSEPVQVFEDVDSSDSLAGGDVLTRYEEVDAALERLSSKTLLAVMSKLYEDIPR